MTPKRVILHCSDTPSTMDIGVKEIKQWHTDPKKPDDWKPVPGQKEPRWGNGWADVGYHYVIRRDGTVERGRAESKQGSHCYGENHDSLGVCLVGGRRSHPSKAGKASSSEEDALFTETQLEALDALYLRILVKHKIKWSAWSGHCEHTAGKTCPNISMDEVRLRFSRL